MGRTDAAAIVPAFDEAATVGEVVRALKASMLLGEVIVVDDGSGDRTAEVAAAAGAKVVRLPENLGKGEAVLRGATATQAPVLLLCDADFLGFTAAHAERLLRPVLEGRLAMCAGLRDRGPILTGLIAHLPLLSGERALRRDVLERLPPRFLSGFRLEIALNWACRVNGLPYGAIPTLGVTHVRKMEKRGVLRGLLGYLRMAWEVAEAMIRVRFARKEFLRPHVPA